MPDLENNTQTVPLNHAMGKLPPTILKTNYASEEERSVDDG